MKNQNLIGLDNEKTTLLAEKLNILLANYAIFYQNARGYHWNVEGEHFFELHTKFEELYNDLKTKLDEIAERILSIGETPEHRYSVYNSLSKIKESIKLSDGKKIITEIISSFQTILSLQREILTLSTKAEDEGSSNLLSDYIRAQEKVVWMYSAYLR